MTSALLHSFVCGVGRWIGSSSAPATYVPSAVPGAGAFVSLKVVGDRSRYEEFKTTVVIPQRQIGLTPYN